MAAKIKQVCSSHVDLHFTIDGKVIVFLFRLLMAKKRFRGISKGKQKSLKKNKKKSQLRESTIIRRKMSSSLSKMAKKVPNTKLSKKRWSNRP
jgi:hypothetical protein